MTILYSVLAVVWGLPIAIILATSVGYGVSPRFAQLMRTHLGF